MFNDFFISVFETTAAVNINVVDFLVCMSFAVILGVFMAKMYVLNTKSSTSFAMTLALLPLAVSMIIMMVNGNIGTGVAVAGAFSLVRFRSVPGTAKEIIAIFTAMCTGLTVGMGYIGFAILFSLIASLFSYILNIIRFADKNNSNHRVLQITIPENLNYSNVFDDVFESYTKESKLISAKTTNMGSLFKLSYEIELNDVTKEKQFVDELRCRNGNLEISIGKNELFINGL